MMYKKIFIIIGIIFLISCGKAEQKEDKSLNYEVVIQKPTAPIDINIWFVEPPKIGEKSTIGFSATPKCDADVELNITLPSGVTLLDGERNWRGKLGKGHKKEAFLRCNIPDKKRREIFATATIIEGKARLTAVCSIIVGDEETPVPKGKAKKNQKGEDIIEFEGKTK